MKDQFVTYEIAKKLKELGFKEPCFKYYGISSKALFDMAKGNETVNNEQFKNDPEDVWCSAPLWQQAIDWLREEKGIDVHYHSHATTMYKCTWWVSKHISGITRLVQSFDAKNKYKQARETAILKALELINK